MSENRARRAIRHAMKRPLTVAEALIDAKHELDGVDASLLLQRVLHVNRAYLAAHPERTLTARQAQAFTELVKRRAAGEPIAYILGEREFYGLNFKITPAVLIPRPETELLVELALARIPKSRPFRVLDLGTGSGAVAVTLALYRRHADVTAVDSSTEALEVARENARALLRDRHEAVRLVQSDWFGALEGERFELIVSNPPYVSAHDPHLAQGDLRFEPRAALTPGQDGLASIRRIVREAVPHLNPGGWLLFEHGYDQVESCKGLLRGRGYVDVLTMPDLAGIPRVSGGRRPPE